MNRRLLRIGLASAALMAVLALLPGCSTTMHHQTIPDPSYRKALEVTDPRRVPHPPPGGEVERAAVERIKAMFMNYNEEALRRNVRQVYADNLYFRDAFKQFATAAEIERYLLEGVKNLRSCTFEFDDVVSSNGDIYLRWVMVVNLRRDKPEQVERSMGMSHMRLNTEGKVVFHQDYWDPTDVIYTRIPVANWLIGKVKAMQ